jgi:hypothetical protein
MGMAVTKSCPTATCSTQMIQRFALALPAMKSAEQPFKNYI